MSGIFGEDVVVGEPRIDSPAGGRLPFILWFSHRRSAQGPLPKSRTTEQSHDFHRTYKAGYRDPMICGVDISSVSLAADRPRRRTGSFPNTGEGIGALAAFCQSHRVELVAMEATGGYEQRALALLSEQGLPVAILNPRAVRQFAQSMGLEKRPTPSMPA